MTDGTTSFVQDFAPGLGASVKDFSWGSALTRRWEVLVAVLAVLSATMAIWLTLDAGFLAHPGWLAVQKADFILGPIGIGLYWRHRRPANRLGLLLIGLGVAGAFYVLQSTTSTILFPTGLIAEAVIYAMTALVILSFPSGRLEGTLATLTFAVVLLAVGPLTVVEAVAFRHPVPSFSISGCRTVCPANGLAFLPEPSWLATANKVQGWMLVAIPVATACVLIWRFVSGTPPRRRALSIGTPIALLFLAMQASYRTLFIVAPNGLAPDAQPVQSALQWTNAATRALVWYGFLFALVGAELYAGRVLRRLVRRSLGRPSFRELEGMLRGPLGDPGLRLGFWRADTGDWVDAEGGLLPPEGADQTSTEIDRDAHPVVLIVHDRQLVDDPELLRAAGAVALLALENAELDAAWKDSLRALAESRARLVRASDKERRKLERDLHDGAQQRLLAALIRVSTADELAGGSPELKRQLTATRVELERAIEELRDLARGIYPTVLSEVGLGGALRSLVLRSPERMTVQATNQRFAPETEAAFYYCCLEAIQNALKHAGPDAQISIRLFTSDGELRLEVSDTGPGFDISMPHAGVGLQSMQDRLGAVSGHVEIRSQPGRGTVVTASVAIDDGSLLLTQAH